MMRNDHELLREYVQNGSELAFSDLVARHLSLVYSAACRYSNGNMSMAEDITQVVFAELGRKAKLVERHPALAGWLYTCVRNVASNVKRSEIRRKEKEMEAHTNLEQEASNNSAEEWPKIRSILDDAMHELSENDRTVVVLRFFEQLSLREVGEIIGINENAARMRVDRAMDKLRDVLTRRGITSTSAGLASALTAGTIITAPSGMAASITASALATATASTTSAFTIVKIMSMTKIKIALAGALLITGVAVPIVQQGKVEKIKLENARLQEQVSELLNVKNEVKSKPIAETASSANILEELKTLREGNEKLQKEVLQLRGKVSAATTATIQAQSVAASAQEKAETNALPAGLSGFMKGVVEQQIMGKLAGMKTKVKLTDTQEEAIREILKKQMDQAMVVSQKMLSGKMSKEDMSSMQTGAGNPEEQIKALLTPEQLELYKNYKTEESTSNARLMANAELLQMQNALGLSQEQQDKAYKALYEMSFNQLSGKAMESMPKTGVPGDALKWQIDQKIKSLETILSPDQLQKYREQQENQAKMISSLMPSPEKK